MGRERRWGAHLAVQAMSQQVDKPMKSMTHGQCDARPMVTFPAAGHHHPLTGTKLYCLVTEAHVCEQLAQGCYWKWNGRESNPQPFVSWANSLTITPSDHRSWHRNTKIQTRPWQIKTKSNTTKWNMHAYQNIQQHKVNTQKTKARLSRLLRCPAWKQKGPILKELEK